MSIPQSGGGLIESHDQLAEYLASGCKPAADWRIGTEHEKFGYREADLLPLDQATAGLGYRHRAREVRLPAGDA